MNYFSCVMAETSPTDECKDGLSASQVELIDELDKITDIDLQQEIIDSLNESKSSVSDDGIPMPPPPGEVREDWSDDTKALLEGAESKYLSAINKTGHIF